MIIDNVQDFNIKQTFECGQCFRWREKADGSYTGVIKDGVFNISQGNKILKIESSVQNDAENIIRDYLDLKTDYRMIKEKLNFNDINMRKATEYGEGIHILNQEPWEMLISFIISAANNIPRISRTIENISRRYGKKVDFENEEYFLFPTPGELSKATIDDLHSLNLGFRDKYVFEATKMVCSREIELEKIKNLPLEQAKKELMKIPGVGEKVADCIMLFSMGKKEAFPVDTWIKKIMNELYINSSNMTKINQYAREKFGVYAGIAQQYLFYYKRSS